MIQSEQLEKSVPAGDGRTWLLRNITLDIAERDILGSMGPSGAGKSTLLNVLGLMDTPGRTFRFRRRGRGKPQRQATPGAATQTIGFIFQRHHLTDVSKARENLDLPQECRIVPTKERATGATNPLYRFRIIGNKDPHPDQLSGGQQPPVAVARSAITRPRLLRAGEALGDEAERVAPGRWLARAGHARIPAHSPQRGGCR